MEKLIYKIDEMVTTWLIKNISNFSLKFCDINSIDEFGDKFKSFCELCFLLNFIDKNDEFYKIAKNMLIENIKREDWDSLLISNPSTSIALHSIEHFYLKEEGKSIFIENNYINFSELYFRAPYRMIEIGTFLILNKKYDNKFIENFMKETILGKNTNINHLSYLDIYSITHELMYIFLLKETNNQIFYNLDLNKIKNILLELTVYCAIEGNIDVMAELVFCLGLENYQFSNKDYYLIKKALEFINNYQNKDGSIIGHINQKNKDELNFKDIYHTTSVLKGLTEVWKKKI